MPVRPLLLTADVTVRALLNLRDDRLLRQGSTTEGLWPTFSAVSKSAKAAAEELPFEEALQKLESIVESMESGELPLEKLLARFEEGTQLARQCQSRLADAELKIQKLEQNLAGDLTVKPMSVETDAADRE